MKRENLKKSQQCDLMSYEKELYSNGIELIAGVDEVGRGPLVGPVVAAAVILPKGYTLEGLNDSKKLTAKKRNAYYEILLGEAISIGLGEASPKEIDELNIYQASRLAMMRALANLKVQPEHVLVDAMPLVDLNIPSTSIIHGDALSHSIAAASVVAKVVRDRMMEELDKKYPHYEFARHKGYPTKKHLEVLEKYGPLDNYRFTYGPVRDLIIKEEKEGVEDEKHVFE